MSFARMGNRLMLKRKGGGRGDLREEQREVEKKQKKVDLKNVT